ncbi:MAG: ABC transporter permease subunit [Conexivisphaerales archaeon]
MAIIWLATLATLTTAARIFLLIGISVISGWMLGYLAYKSRRFESVYVPFVNVMESVPVIGFLPIVLIIFVTKVGGSLGVELGADFLVLDAVVWNIWTGIYQAFKTVPEHLIEVSDNYSFSFFERMKELYIPFSIPKIAANLFPSYADALFYITVSEVFTVGANTYQTFGIGTLLANQIAKGQIVGVYYSLLILAISVIIITVVFSRFSQWAVAKYGIDTAATVQQRQRRTSQYVSRAGYAIATGTRLLSRFATKALLRGHAPHARRRFVVKGVSKYAGIAAVCFILAYVVYSAIAVAISVPLQQWISYLAFTPYLIFSMLVDYVRVLIVAIISLVIAVFLGYWLVLHKRIALGILPTIQTLSAFPAPAYFPLIYATTASVLQRYVPFGYTELYVLFLGFISCFYYVFFGFWIGVQSMPSEFWEIMDNHELGFFTRLRRVVLPSAFPYLISGLSSTINSAWAGLSIGEYWPDIFAGHTLQVKTGMMKIIALSMSSGQIGTAAWASFIFAAVVTVYAIFFTRNLMNLAQKKYVMEEGIYAA